jgi:hypothetical protein
MKPYQRVANRYMKASYRLSTKDKKVIDAFVMERPAEGKALFTDGRVLEKMGLMLGDFAKWVNGKIHILSKEATKSDEVVLRYLIKKAGKGMVRFNYERQNHPEPVSFYNKELTKFLHSGKPITVYHGTTSDFKTFDAKYMRDELLNQSQYIGAGFFFAVSEATAYKYADSGRNSVITYDEVFPLLKKGLPSEVYQYANHLYRHGWDDKLTEMMMEKAPSGMTRGEYLDTIGIDMNDVVEVVDAIHGSHGMSKAQADTLGDLFSMFSGSSSSGRYAVAYSLENLGISPDPILPKVLTCKVRANNVKLVRDLKEAKSARREGYDAIVWYGGEHLVNGEPEVVIFDAKNIQVTNIEIIKD